MRNDRNIDALECNAIFQVFLPLGLTTSHYLIKDFTNYTVLVIKAEKIE